MKRVVIFGATSTIAAAVADRYAARGARLHLVGRNHEKLAALVRRLSTHTEVSHACADLDHTDQSEALVAEAVAALGEIDIALIAHGLLGDQLATERTWAQAEATLRTNLLSPVSLLIPLANALQRQGHGHLAVMSSVAGDRGRPRNYTYGAAKGALSHYLEGVRSRLYRHGVQVSILKLGPVDTPMTATHEKNALFATADGVANTIVAHLAQRDGVAYVPWYWAPIMGVVRNLPEPLFQRLPFLSGR